MPYHLISIIIAIVGAIVLHEYAHGWMAYRCGDSTAKDAGRLTLNPLKHMDPFGSFILPLALVLLKMPPFGWARPVPVNFARLNNPKRDMALVGMAGPAMNVLITVCVALSIHSSLVPLNRFTSYIIFINLVLALFNMIPIPPLDGSRLVMGILPNKWLRGYARLEPFGIMIVIFLFVVLDQFSNLFEHVFWPVLLYSEKVLGLEYLIEIMP